MENILNRRRFLSLAVAGVTGLSFGQASPERHQEVSIKVSPVKAHFMPLDFTGLSYEMGQLYNPEYFSPHNTELLVRFRELSNHGVLRLGGHLSNITPWEGVGQNDPKQVRGVRH